MSDLLPDPPVPVPGDGLPIGAAATACGVSIDTLRYYERDGLLLQATRRDAGGRRRYTERDLAWITGLVMLRETGMPIEQLRRMAALYRTPGTDPERLALLQQHRDRVVAQQQLVARHLAAIETKIDSYRAALSVPTAQEAR